MQLIEIDQYNFKGKVIQSSKPIIVVFYTKWSGAWQISESILKKIHSEFKDRVKFYKVDFDSQKEIADNYGIKKIPTLLFFNNGVVLDSLFGVISKLEIEEKIKQVLGIK